MIGRYDPRIEIRLLLDPQTVRFLNLGRRQLEGPRQCWYTSAMSKTRGDHWFYHPTQYEYGYPEDEDLAYESVRFPSGDERLHGWFFPAASDPKGTVIHCHGNAGNITGHFQFVAWMPSCGWNVLVFDYRGFGRSTGRPTRAGTVADVNAAIDYAGSRGDVDKSGPRVYRGHRLCRIAR
jgi:predicted alpha/beta-fold hydrolase